MRKIRLFIQSWGILELKNAIRMGVGAALSLYVGLKFTEWFARPDPLASGLWCVVATVVVLQANLGGTYKAILNRLSGVLIGSVLGAAFANLWGTQEISLGVAVSATMLVCALFNLKESYRIAALSVASIMIPWGLNPMISPWIFALFRSFDTLIGLIVAVIVSYSIWPTPAIRGIHHSIAEALRIIGQIYTYLLQDKEDWENQRMIHHLERDLQELFMKTHLMLDEAQMEIFMQAEDLPIWTGLLSSLERLLSALQILQSTYRPILQAIFDEELKRQVDDFLEKMDKALQALSSQLKEIGSSTAAIEELLDAEAELTEQLIRFRGTRMTRKFDLNEVERYFVFFYTLKLMVSELDHFNHLLELSEKPLKD